MKVRYKITIAFVVISAIMLVILFSVTYISTISQQENDYSQRLHNRALTVSYLYQKLPSNNYDFLSRVDSSTINLLGSESVYIFNNRNERIYRFARNYDDTVSIPIEFIKQARVDGESKATIENKQVVALYVQTVEFPVVVVVSAVDIVGKANLRELLQNQIKTFIAGLLLSFLAGWFFSRRILNPLQKVSTTVKEISATNIERRLAKGNTKDEWYELTDTFNSLLARLQESFELQGRFIANASHELSTPLTSIRSQIDVVLNKEREKEAYKTVLEHVRSEVQHLGSLTHQLLNIARTSRGGTVQTDLIRVDELLMEIPGIIQKNSNGCMVSIFFDDLPENEMRCMVNGNYELLLAAFKNIAENGCKYAPDSRTQITLSFVNTDIIIVFSNLSESLDPEELENIFQPFQRGNNVTGIKGYGLGLSLVRRIILLHKGDIKIELAGPDRVVISVILRSAA
ncbi:MAG: HAMP domain-containing sensor histidine kinase [Sediminibacterium sp.]